jgi:nucleoside-diphosphate kinase
VLLALRAGPHVTETDTKKRNHEPHLAIIKPDAVESGKAGKILAHLEGAGFSVRAMRLARLDVEQAGAFYAVHEGRPFYDELVDFMTSGPVIPMVLEADDAVPRSCARPSGPPIRRRRRRAPSASSTPSRRGGTPSTPRTRTRTPPEIAFFFSESERLRS